MDWRSLQSWAIAGNVALGILMLAATAVLAEYWRRGRTGPFQFSLRTLLSATALVAVVLALLENKFLHMSALLYPPLAVGLVSLPAVFGLAMQHYMRRSDRRLSELRSRYSSQREHAKTIATISNRTQVRRIIPFQPNEMGSVENEI